MAKLNDLEDVTIENPRVGDVVKYTADGWVNGAQVEAVPPGGNACGGNSTPSPSPGEGLDLSQPQTATAKWTWDGAGCPSIEVKDGSDRTQICADKTTIQNSQVQAKLQVRSDGNAQLGAVNGELYFSDSKNSPPISLSSLKGGQNPGTDEGGFFKPIIINFALDQTVSQTVSQSFRKVDAYQNVEFGYGMGWSTDIFPNAPYRAYDVLKSYRTPVTMPDGANAAIISYQGRTQFGVHNTNGLGAEESYRFLALAHRCDIDFVTFPIGQDQSSATGTPGDYKKSTGQSSKAIISIPHNGADIVDNYRATDAWCKFDLINFTNMQEIVLTARCDVLRGGRGSFKTNLGRIIIFPYYSDNPSDFSWIGPQLGDPSNISGFNLPAGSSYDGAGGFSINAFDDDDYQRQLDAIYDNDVPPESPAQTAFFDGVEYRSLLGRVINALGSRKSYPPDGGATEAEFQARIEEAWDLATNVNYATSEEFLAAFEVYYTEITKDKYGIAFLFEFEKNAGVTSRGLI